MSGRVWIISELYYPDEAATGYLLTKIAEGLAEHFDVSVICGQPYYLKRDARAPRRERRGGVDIYRCTATTFNKNRVLPRLINLITIGSAILVTAFRRLKKSDVVIVVTNPPMLPFLIAPVCRLRRSSCVLLVHDIYPEALEVTGIARSGGWLVKMIGLLSRCLYGSVDRIVVLGRDMAALVGGRLEESDSRVVIIPNWADVELVTPENRDQNELLLQLDLQQKFVVLYAGNIGRTHGLESLLESAAGLQKKNIHFLFIGSGARKQWLERAVTESRLDNVTVLPLSPRSEQSTFLNACDVTVISFLPGMAGVSVPSRMYNYMAAGKPVIAVADSHSEPAQVIEEEQIGWVIPPDRPERIGEVIVEARDHPEILASMGRRARIAAETRYTLSNAINAYRKVLSTLSAANDLR